MAKQLMYAQDARQQVLIGVSKLADAVRVTMGPTGRNVILKIRGGWHGAGQVGHGPLSAPRSRALKEHPVGLLDRSNDDPMYD